MKDKKIVIICIIALALIIGVILGVITTIKSQRLSNQVKETRTKITQINSKELEEKIISELKKTNINVNTSTLKTLFGTQGDLEDEIGSLSFAIDSHYGKSYKDNPYRDYVSAYIVTEDGRKGIVIPCFKIVSDSNGNLKYILYLTDSTFGVGEVVDKVFKNEYGIDKYLTGNSEYYKKFIQEGNSKYREEIEIYTGVANEELATTAIREITKNTYLRDYNDAQLLNWLLNNTVEMNFFGIAD